MAAKKSRNGGEELATIERWPDALGELHARLARLPEPEAPGAGRWLLVRRSISDPTEFAYYLAYAPKETPTEELIRVLRAGGGA